MPVKNPKLLQEFSYKGYEISDEAELELDYMADRWEVNGNLVHYNTGDRIKVRIEGNGPDSLIQQLKELIEGKVS